MSDSLNSFEIRKIGTRMETWEEGDDEIQSASLPKQDKESGSTHYVPYAERA